MKTKSENRKALPKFLIIILSSFILGGILGAIIVFADGDWTQAFAANSAAAVVGAAPWCIWGTVFLNGGMTLGLYCSAKKQYHQLQDKEDDVALGLIEGKLSIALVVTSVGLILSYFFFSAAMNSMNHMGFGRLIASIIAFLLNMFIIIFGQQKIVDLIKVFNPEKKGSVYDTKFAKTWYESCDERERGIIGQAAMASYKATNLICTILWLLLFLCGMLFDLGLLPVTVVTIIWLVSTLSYCIKSMQLERIK